jgi:phosphoglycerate dehydrogenase-like enzyme
MIAEWTAARVLAFQQQLIDLAKMQRFHRWKPREVASVAGTRALVIGTGDIGTAVAKLLKALGCEVIGLSRSGRSEPGVFRAVHTPDKLSSLVGDVHWIVLALPITAATRGLFSREIMSHCRGAVVLNVGRGAVLDEAALPEALASGWLKGAALDVFEVEPLPPTSPLWNDERVIISPHISGITTIEGAGNGFLECLRALEGGELPRWAVDRERGY